MATLVLRTAHTISRSRRSVGGSLSSSVLQYRCCSDGVDGRVQANQEASSAVGPLGDTPLSVEFPPSVPKTQTFGADTSACPPRRWKGLRVGVPLVMLKPQLSPTALNKEESPVSNSLRATNNLEPESCQDSHRQGLFSGKQVPKGSACGGGTLRTSQEIASLKNLHEQGSVVDSYTFVEILKRCSKQKDLIAARQVHDCIIQSGMDKNPFVANTLLNVYVRCGRLLDARQVFDGLERKDAVTWTTMIAGYAQNAHAEGALELFNRMRQAGAQPSERLCLSILKACASPSDLQWGREVHAYIRHVGLVSDVRVGTALVHMYAKCGCIVKARRVFDKLGPNRDVITWNAMIGAYAGSGLGVEAYRLFLQMQREGFTPNATTYVSILNASASSGALEWIKEVQSQALKAGLESDLRVGNALVHMYAKSGSIADARLIFDRMKTRDVVTWNTMIGACAESGCGVEAYRLFLQMPREGLVPDAISYVNLLNAFASAGDLEWLKEVHEHALRAGLEANLRVGNSLVHMYGKRGSIENARLVFDRLKARNLITWNMMIGAYAGSGCGAEAYRLFLKLQQEGFTPNAVTYVSILNAASASVGALEWVKEVRSHALKAGLESDLRLGNALVHMYAKSGSIHDARMIFDELKTRDVITWNVMIGAYAESGYGAEAYELFLQMQREGIIPDAITYVSILNASASVGALEWVKEVHSHALKAGLGSDLRVGNVLVHMYGKIGNIADARLVFDKLKTRDIVTWNTMVGAYAESGCGVEAYRLFVQMQQEGFIPDAITYASILNPSASAGALGWVKEVHSHALKAGLDSDLRVGNALVHMYAKSGSIHDARMIFDRLKTRDVITWNMMIGGYAESECGAEAYRLFLEMEREGFRPDAITYVSVLNAAASAGALQWVKEVHGHALKAGLESDLRVGNVLVHMYGKSGSIEDARLVFDRLKTRDIVTWNTMVGAYAESGCGVEAYRLFLQMQQERFIPNAITYVSILNGSGAVGALDWAKEVHRHARNAGLESDLRVGNSLIHMYAKNSCIDDARRVFDRLKTRNVITWNTMIGAYAESGCGGEAYRLFVEMEREGFIRDAITYVSILNASASAGALEWVKEVHGHALKGGLESDLRVGNVLVHMYAKSGSIDDARLVFDRLKTRDVITWNIMIGGLAQHGYGHEALELFRNMNAGGVKPNGSTFVGLLSACCHAGLLDDGDNLFRAMTEDYGIEPNVMHYTCMVDLLGRAGLLEKAKLFIDNMPVEPDVVTWKSLLGGCRTYGNMKLGKLAADEVLKLEPKDAATYVLLSNIYAAEGKWEQVSSVRSMMQKRGVRKEPGRSWIEVDNKIHEFVAEDTAHPEAEAIFTVLRKLTEKLKAEGYIPDTKVVLRDILEEDRELALCSHSEKLAIAYGLLHTPRGKPIRIYKNLRVCSDCHTATKFISKVTRREIIARDGNRFHHFKDGTCSCGDYW